MEVDAIDGLALLPLLCASVIYWVRDRLRFNRSPRRWWTATATQARVLLVIYPLYTFLMWSRSLLVHEGSLMAYPVALSKCMLSNLASTALLNDSFLQTPQQLTAISVEFVLELLRTTYALLLYRTER